jgi:hypothetical protein
MIQVEILACQVLDVLREVAASNTVCVCGIDHAIEKCMYDTLNSQAGQEGAAVCILGIVAYGCTCISLNLIDSD